MLSIKVTKVIPLANLRLLLWDFLFRQHNKLQMRVFKWNISLQQSISIMCAI